MNGTARASAPWQFWAVAIVSLLWNSFGGYDYTMTKMANMEYLTSVAGSPEAAKAMLDAINGMPAWATVVWALGVWGSLLGSVLLLLRSRHAITAFLVSLVTAVLSFAYQFTTPFGQEMATPAGLAMTAVIVASIVFFWWYSKRAAAKGLLS